MKTRVLITGVAGFIGSNLANRLVQEKKYNVIGIDNLSYGLEEQIPDGVEFHQLDIRSKSIYPLFQHSDFVFHLAAKNSIIDCQNDPVETSDINVTGTVNVFEASRRAGVKKVIYAESSAMYEGTSILPTPETAVVPESFYAVSKYATMYFAEAYSRFFGNPLLHHSTNPSPSPQVPKLQSLQDDETKSRNGSMKFTALRYFCVYGPRQDYRRTIPPVFSSFIIKMINNEQPSIFGSGEKRRDFVHVDDINDFHIKCMEDERTDNEVFNLGSGINYSVNEIYQTIASLLDYKNPPFYKPDLPGEAFANLADISKAKKLGWEPKVSLKEGLRTFIDFINNEIKIGNIK